MQKETIIEKLKSAELVASIQRYFGVIPRYKNDGKNKITDEEYVITNKMWYYLFYFGTAMGDEPFYALFLPFWFWNVDGAVGRRVILVWGINMYIGQLLKDLIQWPRPGAPAFRLHKKWALEYGMPSTHATVAVSIPFSVIIYTMDRYIYNVPMAIIFGLVWCSVICLSRLYLGMHSVLDVIAGILLTVLLMIPLIPLVDRMDHYILTNPMSPIVIFVSSAAMIIYYPNSGKWTPTRGDTTMIIGVCVGFLTGSWLSYQLGIIYTSSKLPSPPPYPIMWPSYSMFGCLIIRTILGYISIGFFKHYLEKIMYSLICAALKEDEDTLKQSIDSLHNKHKTIVDLTGKYFTVTLSSVFIVFVQPIIFGYLKIERPTFFTEI